MLILFIAYCHTFMAQKALWFLFSTFQKLSILTLDQLWWYNLVFWFFSTTILLSSLSWAIVVGCDELLGELVDAPDNEEKAERDVIK